MKTFTEWLEEMHMGRPHGSMGPDGRVYGWSSGPVEKVSGSGTWRPSSTATGRQMSPPPLPTSQSKEEEGLWKANSSQVRLGYLSSIPDAEQQGYHKMDWNDLPFEVKKAASKSMASRSPFKER